MPGRSWCAAAALFVVLFAGIPTAAAATAPRAAVWAALEGDLEAAYVLGRLLTGSRAAAVASPAACSVACINMGHSVDG